MRQNLLLVLGAAAFLVMSKSHAGPREYLFQDERICDTEEVFCISGTLSYHSNPRVLHLRARVKKAPGPGMLRIRLAGPDPLGHRRYAPLEIWVRGHYSEIVNHKMIPDHPDVHNWVVEEVRFTKD